jgi:hypothetical protein
MIAARRVFPRIVVVSTSRPVNAQVAWQPGIGDRVGPFAVGNGDGVVAGASATCTGSAAADDVGAVAVEFAAFPVEADAPNFALSSAGIQKKSPNANSRIHAVRLGRLPAARVRWGDD